MIMLTGCETYYRLPTEPTAKVRFSGAESGIYGLISTYETPACDIGKNGGILGTFGDVGEIKRVPNHISATGNSLKMKGYIETPYKQIERLVSADKPFIFALMGIDNNNASSRCNVSSMFNVQAGEEYEVLFEQTRTQCYLRVFRLVDNKNKIKEESVRNTPKLCAAHPDFRLH